MVTSKAARATASRAAELFMALVIPVFFMGALHIGASSASEREHDSHEHGHGVLNLVVDGQAIFVELLVPGVNVVGFEHAAQSNAERSKVDKAIKTFSRGAALFIFQPGENCSFKDAAVTLNNASTGTGQTQAAMKHGELRGEYFFHCQDVAAIEELTVRVFDHIDADELEVQLVTPTQQTAFEIDAKKSAIDLRR